MTLTALYPWSGPVRTTPSYLLYVYIYRYAPTHTYTMEHVEISTRGSVYAAPSSGSTWVPRHAHGPQTRTQGEKEKERKGRNRKSGVFGKPVKPAKLAGTRQVSKWMRLWGNFSVLSDNFIYPICVTSYKYYFIHSFITYTYKISAIFTNDDSEHPQFDRWMRILWTSIFQILRTPFIALQFIQVLYLFLPRNICS